ncbi:M90 family metallopeptidase [Pseudofulvibacter geojedonensis]|uniref:Zinc-dependent peptidase n=1 Tax=Pseudofulvibacter geojedonensis TaxID=1123758 RepID=A0ABW3I249_9FLAO
MIYYITNKKEVIVQKFGGDLTTKQKNLLLENVLYYKNLTELEKESFTKRVAFFLKTTTIKPVDCKVTDLDKIYIGASAIIPVFGFDNWRYSNLKVVYVFPDAFNEIFQYKGNRNNRRILGMVGTGYLQYKMILSLKALRHGFENKTDKNNTAIHEFVHLIDMADGTIDGLPSSIIEKPYTLPWLDLIHRKIEKIDDGKSDINPYGATSKVEFFAVASEYFFERPKLLKRKHPKLYKKLSIFFKQDLAS